MRKSTVQKIKNSLTKVLGDTYSLSIDSKKNIIAIKDDKVFNFLIVNPNINILQRSNQINEIEKLREYNQTNNVYTGIIQVKPIRRRYEELSSSYFGVDKYLNSIHKNAKLIEPTHIDDIVHTHEINTRTKETDSVLEFSENNFYKQYSEVLIDDENNERGDFRNFLEKEKLTNAKIIFQDKAFDKLINLEKLSKEEVRKIKKQTKEKARPIKTKYKRPKQTDLYADFKKARKTKKTKNGFPLQAFNQEVINYSLEDNRNRNKARIQLDMEESFEFHKSHAYHFAIQPYLEKINSLNEKYKTGTISELLERTKLPENPTYFERETGITIPSFDEYRILKNLPRSDSSIDPDKIYSEDSIKFREFEEYMNFIQNSIEPYLLSKINEAAFKSIFRKAGIKTQKVKFDPSKIKSVTKKEENQTDYVSLPSNPKYQPLIDDDTISLSEYHREYPDTVDNEVSNIKERREIYNNIPKNYQSQWAKEDLKFLDSNNNYFLDY